MREPDTEQRGVRGGVIDHNISILIDIFTIISNRNKAQTFAWPAATAAHCNIIYLPPTLFAEHTVLAPLVFPAISSRIMFFFFSFSLQISAQTIWIASFLQAIIFNNNFKLARELRSYARGFCVISLSLLACVWLRNVVCGPDRSCRRFFLLKVMQCETSCRRCIVQCEHTSNWMLPWIVMQCEKNSDPTTLKIVQSELGIT